MPFVNEVRHGAKVTDAIFDIGKGAKKASKTLGAIDDAYGAGKVIRGSFEKPNIVDVDNWDGWEDITPELMRKNSTSRTYRKNGTTVRFDKGNSNANGYLGKDHYHILNPNATGKHDYYLDEFGNPVPKNSKASHILIEKKESGK